MQVTNQRKRSNYRWIKAGQMKTKMDFKKSWISPHGSLFITFLITKCGFE